MCEKGIVVELPELQTVLARYVVICHGVAVVVVVHGLCA